jgi:hypothetical protein
VDAWVQLARHQPERRGYFRGDDQEQPAAAVVVEQRRNGPAAAASSPPPPPPSVAPLRRLLTVTRQQARQLSADDAASVLWALAKLGPSAGGGGGGSASSSSSAAAIAAAAADAGVLEALLARVVARNSSSTTTTTTPTPTPTTAAVTPLSPLPPPPSPRSAALSAWALARLGWSPEPRLWDAFFGAAAPAARLGLFSARDLSNVAWALARLRQRPSAAWLRAFCAAAEPWLLPVGGAEAAEGVAATTVDSQSLATLLLGLANLPPAPSGAGGAGSTASARAQQQQQKQSDAPPPALATWAERVLANSPALRASGGLATLDARALASIPGALHKLGARPEALRPWLATELAPEALRRLTTSAAAAALTAKDVAELAWALERAFASSSTRDPLLSSVRELRAALARRLAQTLESGGGEEVVGRVPSASATAQALRALVALGGRRPALSEVDDSAVQAAAAATARALPRLLPRAALRDVADLAWALAEEGGDGMGAPASAASAAAACPSLLAATRRLLSSPGAAASDPRAVAVALAGLARLQQQQKQQQQQGSAEHASADPSPPHPTPPGWQWFLPVFEATRPLMIPAARCPWAARDLAMAGWAVARLGQRPPAAWLGAYLAAVRAQLLPGGDGSGTSSSSSFSPLAHAAWAIAHPSWGLTPRRLEELAPGFAGEFAAAVLSAASSSPSLTAAEAAALLRAVPAVLGASSPAGAACARALLEAASPALRRCCSDGLEAAQQQLLSLRELLHLTLPAARLAARPRAFSGDGVAATFDDAGWAADAADALAAAADATHPVPAADLSAALAVVGRLHRATATGSAATTDADRARLSRAADALAARLAAALGNNAGLELASAAAAAAAAAACASPAGAFAVMDAALRRAADDGAAAVRCASLEELARLLQAAAAIVRQQQDQAAETVSSAAISTVLNAADARLMELLLPVDEAGEAQDEEAAALEEQQQQHPPSSLLAPPRQPPSLPTPLDRRPDRPQPQQPQPSTRAAARDRVPSRPSSARAAAAVLCAFAALRPQSVALPPPEASERLLRLAAAQDGGSLRALSVRQTARLAHAVARLYHGSSNNSASPPAWLLPALWQRLSLPVRRPLPTLPASADPLPPSSAAAAVATPSVASTPPPARIGDMVEASTALAALTTTSAAAEEDGLLPPPLAAQVFRTAGRRWAELLTQPPHQQVRLLRALVRLAPLVSEGTVAHFARGVLEAEEEEGAQRGSGSGGGEGEEAQQQQRGLLTPADRLRRRRLRSALAAMWSACRVNKQQQRRLPSDGGGGDREASSGGGLVVVATSDDGRVPVAVMPSAAAVAAAAASRASAVAV